MSNMLTPDRCSVEILVLGLPRCERYRRSLTGVCTALLEIINMYLNTHHDMEAYGHLVGEQLRQCTAVALSLSSTRYQQWLEVSMQS